MSVTGLEVLDATVHKTNTWLKRLTEIAGWEDRRTAYRALRATLHAIRDRLSVEEVADLSAQLPMLVRGIYFEAWDPTGKPLKERHVEEFLARVELELRGDPPIDPETAARAVFRLLDERVTDGEMEDVLHLLPAEIRRLAARAPGQSPAESRPGVS